MNHSLLTGLCAVLFSILSLPAQTPLPSAFFYQGRLVERGQPANGFYEFQLHLHAAATGGTALGTVVKEDVRVTDGVFHLDLDFGAAAFNGEARWLEIEVRQSNGPDFTLLAPRQPLLAAPHALFAAKAGTVPDGSITQNKIAAGQVTNAALADNGVTGTKIADATIEGHKLQTGAVSAVQLSDGAVTEPKIAAGAVTGAKLTDLAVTSSKLAFGAVTTGRIATAAVTSEKLAPGAIGQQHLSQGYRSGVQDLSNLPNDFVPGFKVNLTPAFGSAPVVVTGFKNADASDLEGAVLQCTETSASAFSVRVAMPATFAFRVHTDSDAALFGDGMDTASVNGSPAGLYSRDLSASNQVGYSGRTAGGLIVNSTLDSDFLARECSLAVMNGLAMAVYLGEDIPGDPNTQRMRFAQATNADASAWNILFDFNNATAAGWSEVTLLNVAGRPAVTYHHEAGFTHTIRYRRAGTDLTAWPAATVVHTNPDMNDISRMIIVNGRPAIAYLEDGRAWFIRAADATGSAWLAPIAVSTQGAGSEIALAVIDGHPAIAYHHDYSIYYTRALDGDGASWPADGNFAYITGYDNLGLHEDGMGRPCITGSYPLAYFQSNDIHLITSESDSGVWTDWVIRRRSGGAGQVAFARYVTGHMGCWFYEYGKDGRRHVQSISTGYQSGDATWIAVEP